LSGLIIIGKRRDEKERRAQTHLHALVVPDGAV
jgi:hypothetical protein